MLGFPIVRLALRQVVALPASSQGAPGRNSGTTSERTPCKPLGHVRFLQASEDIECGSFRASSSKATQREKDLAIASCERSGHDGFGSRRGPMATKAILVCCQSYAGPQAAARFCPALEDRPRPDTGCNRPG